MKQIKFKIYVAFLSLCLLMLLISGFFLVTASRTFNENQELKTKSIEINEILLRLDHLTSQLSLLGQKHVLTKDHHEMNFYNSKIDATYYQLNDLFEDIKSNKLLNENNRLLNDDIYTNFQKDWSSYWFTFNQAMRYSQSNNDRAAYDLLVQSNDQFEHLNTLYLRPLALRHQELRSSLDKEQATNWKNFLWLGVLLFISTITIFVFAFIYLYKILKAHDLLKRKLEYLSYHDELTSLPNRRLFQQQVTKAIHEGDQTLAIMYLDMDKFKHINDNFGHDIGDLVIIEFTKRIQGCVRDSDVFGRQGGDEFTILLREISEETMIEVAKRIIDSFQNPLRIEGTSFDISTSIGIAIYPDHGNDYKTLIKNSDLALYEAKKQRNIYKFYNEIKN